MITTSRRSWIASTRTTGVSSPFIQVEASAGESKSVPTGQPSLQECRTSRLTSSGSARTRARSGLSGGGLAHARTAASWTWRVSPSSRSRWPYHVGSALRGASARRRRDHRRGGPTNGWPGALGVNAPRAAPLPTHGENLCSGSSIRLPCPSPQVYGGRLRCRACRGAPFPLVSVAVPAP